MFLIFVERGERRTLPISQGREKVANCISLLVTMIANMYIMNEISLEKHCEELRTCE